MFRKQIRRVYVAPDFTNLDRAYPHLLLHPQGVSLEVPEFAEPGSRRDAQRGTRVGPDPHRYSQAEIAHYRLVA